MQDTASSNQAALQQLQSQLEEQHQVQHQQQENMVAIRAQVLQSDLSCSSNTMACAELHTNLQHVQQRLDQCCRDITRQADQLVSIKEQHQVGGPYEAGVIRLCWFALVSHWRATVLQYAVPVTPGAAGWCHLSTHGKLGIHLCPLLCSAKWRPTVAHACHNNS